MLGFPYTGGVAALRPFVSVLAPPTRWVGALRAGWAMRARTGWRRWLPLPERRYWAWRLHTAWGDTPPDPADIPPLIAWRARLARVLR